MCMCVFVFVCVVCLCLCVCVCVCVVCVCMCARAFILNKYVCRLILCAQVRFTSTGGPKLCFVCSRGG